MGAYMVQQIIKYSDGTETVIDYRGQIVNGVLIPNGDIMSEEEKVAEVAPEVPADEVELEAPEVSE